ncbi:MAG: ATP-binding protein [Bacillota bacterium]|nr:ATP-binding protein [Bacillota bacterium]
MSLVDDLRERLRAAEAAGRTRETLLEFIAQRLPESTVLDYKRTLDLAEPRHRRTLARTVAAFANAHGGVLVLGVAEKDRTGEPDAEAELTPVTTPVGVDLSQQITNIVNDLVRPTPRYDLVTFPAGDGRGVVVFVWAGEDRPYTVQDGADFEVPVRRGTSVVGASREELDRIYEGRTISRMTLEAEGEAECRRYVPAALLDVPLAFIYIVPDIRRPDLLSLEKLNANRVWRPEATYAYRNLPPVFPMVDRWSAHEEAATHEVWTGDRESYWSSVVVYRDGRLAAWYRLLNVTGERVSPVYLIHALHATLGPYARAIREFGLLAGFSVMLSLCNVSRREVDPLVSGDGVKAFAYAPRPRSGRLLAGASHEDVDRLCFWLWEQALRAAGEGRQLHDWSADPIASVVYNYLWHAEPAGLPTI